MIMRFLIASLVCKALTLAGKILGGGTDTPGRIALKIYPHAMKKIRFSGKVIAVTGSNGKTTTSNLITHILKNNGYSVVSNELGSNMTSGIASTLLSAASVFGRIKSDFVVLETDECYSRFIFEDVKPDYYLVLNLLRDQVVRNGNPDLVFQKIAEAVALCPDTTLILNANEPISQALSLNHKGNVVYFSMEKNSRSTDSCVSGTNDAKICPVCYHKIKHSFFHYNHLGEFSCTNCSYSSHSPDYFGSEVDFENKTVKINGNVIKVPFDTTYNMFNSIAAVAALLEMGITYEEISAHIGSFSGAKGRFETFEFDGRKTVLLMTKQNAASLDQSISYTLEQEGDKTVVLFINNVLYLDYKDISWLYDVAFSRLNGKVKNILCTGNRALDAAVCLKAAGFNDDVLLYEPDIAKVKQAFRKTSGDIYLLAASAFGHEGKIIEELKK